MDTFRSSLNNNINRIIRKTPQTFCAQARSRRRRDLALQLTERLDDDNLPHRPLSSLQIAQRRRRERERASKENITSPLARRQNGMQRRVTDHADGTTPDPARSDTLRLSPPNLSQRQHGQRRRQERE